MSSHPMHLLDFSPLCVFAWNFYEIIRWGWAVTQCHGTSWRTHKLLSDINAGISQYIQYIQYIQNNQVTIGHRCRFIWRSHKTNNSTPSYCSRKRACVQFDHRHLSLEILFVFWFFRTFSALTWMALLLLARLTVVGLEADLEGCFKKFHCFLNLMVGS